MKKPFFVLPFFLFFLDMALLAQTRHVVSGRVVDTSGVPLNGATIKIFNTGKGTTADLNGFFKVDVLDSTILVFSAIGYETKEVNTANSLYLDVQLTLVVQTMSVVVVTGVGIPTSKRRLGISVETINSEKLPSPPGNSLDQALIGKIPGAQISGISGNPGDPVNILLRGINTVAGPVNPLVLLDGVGIPFNDISSIDLSQIDKIEVVQGAASATIYGAQGANGVIQVFTKKGKKGPVAINFSTSYSMDKFLNNGNVHKADLHPFLTDANNNILDINTGLPLSINGVGTFEGISYAHGGPFRYAILDTANIANKPYNANLPYYDHYKQIFQTGHSVFNSVSISGASDKNDFLISFGRSHTLSALLRNGAVDKSNFLVNMGTEIIKGLTLRSITQLIYTNNTLKQGLGARNGEGVLGSTEAVWNFEKASPFFDLNRKLDDGTYPYRLAADFLSVGATNPNYTKQYNATTNQVINVIESLAASYKVNKFLELDAKFGIDYRTQHQQFVFLNQSENLNSNYYSQYIGFYAPDNTGEIYNIQVNNTSTNFLGTATVKTNLKKDFSINLPVQTSTQVSFDYRRNYYTDYENYGVSLPLLPPINLSSTAFQAVSSDYKETFITYGYLVNQKIDFSNFAGITAGFRSDWSSAFGKGSKPFTFPHVDGYLLISGLLQGDKLKRSLPLLKLRAAFGKAGIQPHPFGRYPTLSQSNLGNMVVYSIPNLLLNPDLQVEVTREFEIGTDCSFVPHLHASWLTEFNFSFSYWKRKSDDVIFRVDVAPSNGYTGQLTNAINMSSSGIQFSLNIPVYKDKIWNWDFTTNFGRQSSIIEKIKGGQDIILESGGGFTSLVLTEGKKIGQLYGYKALTSLDYKRQDGTPYIAAADKNLYTMVDGLVVLKSTKQIQFTDEKYPLGDPAPAFNASFINNFSYRKLIGLSVQFDWIYGSHLYNQTKQWMYRDGVSGDFTKPVTIDGNTGAYTAYWSSPYYNLWGSLAGAGNNATKDYFFEDASFLRLRNIALSFELKKLLGLATFKKLELVISGRNILTFTKYTGLDPEVSSGYVNSAADRGTDFHTLPNTKSFQLRLNVGF